MTIYSWLTVMWDIAAVLRVLIASNETFAGRRRRGFCWSGRGGTAIHQFCRVGRYSFIGGGAKVEQDIPPFMLGDGHPAKIRMFNKVGLERNGFDSGQISVKRYSEPFSVRVSIGSRPWRLLRKATLPTPKRQRYLLNSLRPRNAVWLAGPS